MSAGRFVSKLVRIGARRHKPATISQVSCWQRYRKLFYSAALPLFLVAPSWADPVSPTTFIVTSSSDGEEAGTLRYAINQANQISDPVVIVFDPGVTRVELSGDLPVITKDGDSLKITGNGAGVLTLDGNDQFQVFTVRSGTVTIEDLTITDGRATGGNGGNGRSGGGGGLGAGGAIFVDEAAAVIVQDVALTGNSAVGGNGGNVDQNSFGGGGGGGMNGGDGANTVGDNEEGGDGGGPNGGAGGNYQSNGGAGGDYSGGGGGAIYSGTASTAGGAGGFGGGGGGGTDRSGGTGGTGGFGGGDGGGNGTSAKKGGNGGDGLGGAIFVRAGGSLTIIDGSLGNNSVTGGKGGVLGTNPRDSSYHGANGSAEGSGIYLNDTSLNYQVSFDNTVTITNSIAGTGYEDDDRTTAIIKGDVGTLNLHGSNTFEGDVVLDAGSLGLNSSSSLGATGNTLFAAGSTEIKYNASFTDQHDVLLGGSTYFNTFNNDVTLQGDISGDGTLNKDGTGTLTLSGTNTFTQGIIFGAGKVALDSSASAGSGQFTFADGMLVANADLELSNSGSLLSTGDIDNGGHTVKLNGVFSSPGGVSGGALSLENSGTVELAGANTFRGDILVNGGELLVTTDENLGDTGNDIFLSNGATFTANDGITLGSGRDIFLDGQNTIKVADTFNLVIDQDSTIADGESAGTLVKEGGGTLYLIGQAKQTGGTIINDGIITIRNSDSIAGDLTINEDGTFDNYNMTTTLGALSGSGKLQIGLLSPSVAGSFTTDSSTDSTFDGKIVGKGKFTKSGDGTLTFGGENSSTFSGEYILKDGTLALDTANLLGAAANTITFNGGTLRTDNDLTIAQKVKLTSTGVIDNNGHNATFSGVISGSNGLQLEGSGTTALSGVNTFTGDITVDGGRLSIGSNSSLGNDANDLILKNEATLQAANDFDTGANRTIYLDGENSLNVASGRVLILGTGSSITDLDDDTAGTLDKTGFGTLTLNGVANHTGGTVVSGGELKLGGDGVLGGNVELKSMSILNLNHTIVNTFTGLTGYGSVSLGGSIDPSTPVEGTLNIDGDEDSTFYGAVTGNGSIHKSGTGTFTLSGIVSAPSASDAVSTVSGGTLQVQSIFQGAIDVQSGGTLRGIGLVSGITVEDGGILAAGSADAVGTLNATSLTVEDGGTINLRVGEPDVAGGINNDYINVTGDVSLSGTINVSNSTDNDFQFGVYRLIGYGGSFEDNGVALGTVPDGTIPGKSALQTSVAGQVNLVYDATQFWNGSFNTANNQINGGDGVWNSSNTNWTDKDGASAAVWDGYFAAFAGQAGTVTVEGQQSFYGLQFLTDGYTLTGGSLNLADDGQYGVRVDDGVSATIGTELVGSGTLVKLDPGTLRIDGTNTAFTGDVELRDGTLAVDNSLALGSGKLVNIGSTTDIQAANVLELGKQVELTNDIDLQGFLNIRTTEDFADLKGDVTATEVESSLAHSVLLKSGTPILNVYGTIGTQGIQVDAGAINFLDVATITQAGVNLTLAAGTEIDFNNNQVIVDAISGTGTIRFDDKLTLGGTSGSGSTIAATLAGTGALHKIDGRTLTIDVANLTHTGGTVLSNGMLYLQTETDASYSGDITGGGGLGKSGAGVLTLTEDLGFTGIINVAEGTLNLETGVLDANVLLGSSSNHTQGILKFSNSGNIETAAVISGDGDVVIAGTGATTFSGASTYLGDTVLEAGELKLAQGARIGTGTLKAEGGQLEFLGEAEDSYELTNNLELNKDLTIAGIAGGYNVLSGDLSGDNQLTLDQGTVFYFTGDNQGFTGDIVLEPDLYLEIQGEKSLIAGNNVKVGSLSRLRTAVDITIGELTGDGILTVIDSGSTASVGADTDFEFNGAIGGAGNLEKTGSGDMWLNSGNATLGLDGSVTISDGSLTGTAFNFNNKDLTNNALLVFKQSDEGSYDGVISGSGDVQKSETGTLTLTGANSYTGKTVLKEGKLLLEGETAAIGTGTLQIFNGSLEVDRQSASTLTNDIELNGDFTVTAVNDYNLVLSGDISEINGPHGLTTTGSGTIILEGDNIFSGDVKVQNKALYVASDKSLYQYNNVEIDSGSDLVTTDADALIGKLTGSGNVYFLGGSVTSLSAHDFEFEGNIQGDGDFIKDGLGAMTLSGQLQHTGTTTVAGGTLTGTAAAFNNKDLINNATVKFSQDEEDTYGGVISGNGDMVVEGENLIITGANSYAGTTTLNGVGITLKGATAALGTGTVIVNRGIDSESTLQFDTDNHTLINDITLNVGNTLNVLQTDGVDRTTLSGEISGLGSLVKQGAGALFLDPESSSSFVGTITVEEGSLEVENGGALGGSANTVVLEDGTSLKFLDDGLNTTIQQSVQISGSATLYTGSYNVNLTGAISDAATTDTLTLSGAGLGHKFTNQGSIELDGQLILNAALTHDTAGSLNVGKLQIDADAGLSVKSEQTVIGELTGSGDLFLDSEESKVVVGSVSDSQFDGDLLGVGGRGAQEFVKKGTGTLTLNGEVRDIDLVSVNDGTLQFEGTSSNSSFEVNDGGVLRGNGSAGDVTLNSGATLAAGSEVDVGTFTVNSLTMKSGSQVNFRLGEAEVAGGAANDFINVNGDLTLNGLVNIEQSNDGDFTFGTYRLFNYGGTLVDNGIQLGDAPVGTTSSEIQTAIAGQVNIVLSSTQFWNGSVVAADGTIHGGDGVWDSTTTNWTTPNGTTSSRWMETVGVFAGEAGTVTVVGPQTFTGLQFSTDGYQIVSGDNGSLQTDDDDSGIRVDADVTATIAAALSGTGELQKLGSGTLVLSGDNSTFAGGVLLSQGTLRVEHNNALGSKPLFTENDSVLDLANGISLSNIISVGDILTVRQDDVNGVADLNSSLNGDKSTTLIKDGVGTLNINSRLRSGNIVGNEGVLNFTDTAAIHTELESLTVAAGAEVDFNTRVTSVDKVTGSGTVRFDDSFQLGSDDDTELAATLAGEGTFIKDGSGLLDAADGKLLNTGGIEIRNGALALGTQTVTGEISGSGSLQINSATTTVKDAISATGGVSLKSGHLITESGTIGSTVTFLDDDELSSLTFAATGDVVHNQLITGKGQVIQQGEGVLTLQLANTYSGGTVFDSGTIAASSSSNLGSGSLTFLSGTLQVGADVNFGQNVVLQQQGTINTNGFNSTLSGVISGAGELVKNGDGILTLSGANTYTGGTTINQGTLRGSTNSLVGDIENNATLMFQQNTDGTFAGDISGTGSLIKRFAGTVTLTGTNSYSGGTTIEGGALQGTTGSLQGNILNDASLIFNQTTDGTYGGIISGTGSLTKLGSGAVFLSGANTYTGGTTVTAGELGVTTSSLPGNVEIQSQGSLVFDQTVNGTYAGILSGDGTLGKRGDSTVTLTGNSTFTGNTVVEAGRLVNNGDLLGQTSVGAGSTLGGNGTFGSLQVQGTIAPGNSIGTLNVVNDYVQSTGSTYEVEVNPDGSSDLIDVGGTATIESNATVAVSLYPLDASTRFFNAQTFTILTAADGIDGVFDNVTDDLAGWDVTLLPVAFLNDQYQLQIQLFRNWAAVEAAATTPNQMQVLTTIIEANDTLFTDSFLEIVEELQTLEGAQARAALDSLSGVIHATMPSLAIQQTTLNLSMVSDRARRNGSGMAGLAMSNGAAPQMVARSSEQSWDSLIRGQSGSLELTSGWVSGYGAGGNVTSNGNAAGMNYNIGGTVFGIDRTFDDGVVGIAGNYGKMSVTGDAGSGSNDVDLFYLTSYGRKQFENVYVLAAMGYGYQGYDAGRTVTVGTSMTPASASYHGNQFHSYTEIGQTYDVGAAQVTPLAGLQYITMRRSSFTESGPAGLDVASDGVDSLRTNLGARLDFARSTRSGAIFSPYLQASWMSELLDGGRVMSAQFTGAPGSNSFQVYGNGLGRNYGVFGTGVNYMPTDGVQLFLGYDAQVGRWYSLHSGMGGVQFQW